MKMTITINTESKNKSGRAILRFAVMFALLFALGSSFTGCALMKHWAKPALDVEKKQKEMEEKLRLISDKPEGEVKKTEGSLWDLGNDKWSFVTDSKAFKVGDILLVNIVESASAEKTAGTKLDRKGGIKANVSQFLGKDEYFSPVGTNDPKMGMDLKKGVEANMENSHDADTETKRTGTLTARISTIVTEVFPNGNVKISGSQSILLNYEEQLIFIEGIVRPNDINPDNSIDSPLIANAHIEYTGNGVLNDKQSPGFMMRIIDYVWPF